MTFDHSFFKLYFPHQKWKEVAHFYAALSAGRKAVVEGLSFKNPWKALFLSGTLGMFGAGRFYTHSFALGAFKLVYFIFLIFSYLVVFVLDKQVEIPYPVLVFILLLALGFGIWYGIDFIWSFWRTRRYNYRLIVKTLNP